MWKEEGKKALRSVHYHGHCCRLWLQIPSGHLKSHNTFQNGPFNKRQAEVLNPKPLLPIVWGLPPRGIILAFLGCSYGHIKPVFARVDCWKRQCAKIWTTAAQDESYLHEIFHRNWGWKQRWAETMRYRKQRHVLQWVLRGKQMYNLTFFLSAQLNADRCLLKRKTCRFFFSYGTIPTNSCSSFWR